ncbi:transcription-repair coupling factor (superfamily II helicase) [Sphingobium sp. B2D3A]|uniref:TRCF domain-containing protein n=1 Tax=unclassified Sphingobium TaxID=2611147 RepID=UPI0022246F1A|nr:MULTISPECIES: TRCF domain-containing protein [unclassified Sphingobium]MCW2338855.1 transcription-repair coupling factor (superfamily II helicase) [Sphingobium sp. B2D3A]MCW2385281.1 transcription-repair coupling factor (superfamily II helicase) [Sphingobium sp. B2D3D]
MSGGHGVGVRALTLWKALQAEDVLYLADDEQEAEALAAALGKLAPENVVIFLPSSDTLPGDSAPASPANIGQRVAALRMLRRSMKAGGVKPIAVVMSGEAAARLYPDPSAFNAAPPTLREGDKIDPAGFAQDMNAIGYVSDDRVDEPGEIAVRGEVIDIYPADAGAPARIEISDGQIASIRHYDPATQLSTGDCEALEIGRALEPTDGRRCSILAHLRPGRLFQSGKADQRRRRFARLAAETGAEQPADAVAEGEWRAGEESWKTSEITDAQIEALPRFAEQRAPLNAMVRFVKPRLDSGDRLLLVGSERDVRFLRSRIAHKLGLELQDVADLGSVLASPKSSGGALIAPIDAGAVGDGLIMLAAADLLGSRALLNEAPETASSEIARAGGDIRVGDVVVHEDHGVARVLGLNAAPAEGGSEAIILEYAGGTRRLVPAGEAGRIWRYGADADAVKLDKLDGTSWTKRRSEIDEATAANAKALLKLAQQRMNTKAPLLEPEAAAYERFVATFAFNETADQARAIAAVRDDLASGRPMDRLIIGDVGYGKTEVALRAAALAALAGHQVVVAAPTTVLVRQHLETFERRFAGLGVKVASLSRLSSAAEKKVVKAGLADGSIDIVIGTSAVMAKDVRYAKLGLVVIDEEQRFGAADKAKLRGRADVHLLAMSATPIPRTLHRAMIGLQQISVIATPPARRQPIRTSLAEPNDTQIRTALLRECSRGGQSFVVVPRIEDLAPLSERLRRITPDLVLIEAHGKLPAAEIDAAMVRFANGEGDILLATNIIEAGLDVPRANTMLVWHADRFGLAQLHQLRGRVGRGNRRGQVMLFTEGGTIAEQTMKRLRTLTTYDRLGAGFEISAADLDQRGAGDLLSDAQAGHMKLMGVDLYQHLFEAALRAARGEDDGLWLAEVNVGTAGALPEDWIPDVDIRLGLYVRIARASDEGELEALQEELIDRFGSLPDAAERLLAVARIKLLARLAQIERVDAGPAAIALTPGGRRRKVPTGLVHKDGRWLLKERIAEEEQLERLAGVLHAIAR